jgi:hypothetical protein
MQANLNLNLRALTPAGRPCVCSQTYFETISRTVKVPRTTYEDVEISYQVPVMETKISTVKKQVTKM